jgi:hypothetical protein
VCLNASWLHEVGCLFHTNGLGSKSKNSQLLKWCNGADIADLWGQMTGGQLKTSVIFIA